MKKYLILVLLAFLSVACGSDDEDLQNIDVVITRMSSKLSQFEGETTITASLEHKNGFGVWSSDYDSSFSYIDDDGDSKYNEYIVLVKGYDNEDHDDRERMDVSYLKFQQRRIDFVIEDTPRLKDKLTEEQLKDIMLETKIEVFINGKLVNSGDFTFDVNGLNSYKVVCPK